MQNTSLPDEIEAEMMRARRRSSSWKKLTQNDLCLWKRTYSCFNMLLAPIYYVKRR